MFPVLMSKLCSDNWTPEEQWKEGRTGFVEEPTGTVGQTTRGTAMSMISSNPLAFLFTPAPMDGAEECYGRM